MSSDKLRIAFATPEFITEDYFDGGIANYLDRVTRTLANLGHDVHVITLSEIDNADFERQGVKVHRATLSKKWTLLDRVTRYRIRTVMRWVNLSVQVYRRLKELGRQKPFDLIQYPNYSLCGLISILLLRTPHVLRASSYEPFLYDTRTRRTFDYKLLRLLGRLQDRLSPFVYSPSHNLKRLLVSRNGLKNVRVIPSPIFLEKSDCDSSVHEQLFEGKSYVLFFGRFEERKGFHILAQALAKVMERQADVRVVLVGRDVSTVEYPSMAAYALSVCGQFADRLILMNKLPRNRLYPIIANAKLVVLPSLTDNLPNACLEAMALGKPVIGTQGASFEEMITDEETGFLVPPNNPDALAEKIIFAWEHPGLKQMGAAAEQRASAFSPVNTVPTLLSYYREIIERSADLRTNNCQPAAGFDGETET